MIAGGRMNADEFKTLLLATMTSPVEIILPEAATMYDSDEVGSLADGYGNTFSLDGSSTARFGITGINGRDVFNIPSIPEYRSYSHATAKTWRTCWLVAKPNAVPIVNPYSLYAFPTYTPSTYLPFCVQTGESTTNWSLTEGNAGTFTHYKNGSASSAISSSLAVYAAVGAASRTDALTYGCPGTNAAWLGQLGLRVLQNAAPNAVEIAAVTKLIARYYRIDLNA